MSLAYKNYNKTQLKNRGMSQNSGITSEYCIKKKMYVIASGQPSIRIFHIFINTSMHCEMEINWPYFLKSSQCQVSDCLSWYHSGYTDKRFEAPLSGFFLCARGRCCRTWISSRGFPSSCAHIHRSPCTGNKVIRVQPSDPWNRYRTSIWRASDIVESAPRRIGRMMYTYLGIDYYCRGLIITRSPGFKPLNSLCSTLYSYIEEERD